MNSRRARYCFVLHLNPGQGPRYDQLHRDMEPRHRMAVAACGLHNYTLFRDRDLVVGYVEAGDDLLAALAELEASDGFADWASRFTGTFATGTLRVA